MALASAAFWFLGKAFESAAAGFLAVALPAGQAFGARGVALAGGAFRAGSFSAQRNCRRPCEWPGLGRRTEVRALLRKRAVLHVVLVSSSDKTATAHQVRDICDMRYMIHCMLTLLAGRVPHEI